MKLPLNWLPVICLVIAVVLSVASLFSPIWRLQTSRTDQINTNITRNAYYFPSQVVMAEDPSANKSEQVLISDLGGSNTNFGGIAFLFSFTTYLAVAGIVLVIIALGLTIISIIRKPIFNYASITALIGAILMLVDTVYFVATAPSVLSTLNTIMPLDIAQVSGNMIVSLWGSAAGWSWAGGLGLVLLFTGSLFAGSAMLLIRALQERMKPSLISF